jgi:hypothetical protein
VIDGLNTILTEEYFVSEEVPRFLAKCIDDGYKIWINMDRISSDMLNHSCIPFWLKQEIVLTTPEIIKQSKVEFTDDSMIISKDVVKSKSLKLNLHIFTIDELFSIRKYKVLKLADIYLCFGFNIAEFVKYCNESNCIGVEDNEIIVNVKNSEGVAFLIKDSDLTNQYNEAMKYFDKLVDNKKYKVKRKEYIIGITYKGKGFENVNLNIFDNGEKLPLLFV